MNLYGVCKYRVGLLQIAWNRQILVAQQVRQVHQVLGHQVHRVHRVLGHQVLGHQVRQVHQVLGHQVRPADQAALEVFETTWIHRFGPLSWTSIRRVKKR